jgi:hypothetical protein
MLHEVVKLQNMWNPRAVDPGREEADVEAGGGPDGVPAGVDEQQILLTAVERFAMLLTEAGMPRMPARVFSYLLIEEQADGYTAGELAAGLQVSPAAISGAVRYLTQTGFLVRGRRPGARSDHYRLHADVWYETYMQRSDLLQRWDEMLSETIDLLGPDRAGPRLHETRDFMRFLRSEMTALLHRWQAERATRVPGNGSAREGRG